MKPNDILKKLGIVLFCVLSAFLFLLFFSQTLSPLYTIEVNDGSVFKMMGQAILRGKVPYADLFDHKGPMLYAIEAFGQWLIPGRNGLFILAVIGLSISVFCWYKTARLFTSPIKSVIIIILTLISYYFYSEYGNLVEDWSIPFISVSYYLILLLLNKEKSSNYTLQGLLIGLCLAGSFFIRPNDAVAFIGAPIFGVIVWMIYERRFKELLLWIGGICIGFLIITLTFVIWFAYHHALSDFWYGLIGFNAKYAGGIKGLIKGCLKITKLNYLPFLITLLVLCYNVKNGKLLFVLVPSVIAAYILKGNYDFPHYWIAWIPVLYFSFFLFATVQQNKAFTILAACVFLSLPIFKNSNWLKTPKHMYQEVKHDLQVKDSTVFYTQHLFQDISNSDKDSIWSYNLTWSGGNVNTFNVLLRNEIVPCNRVPLIFMVGWDESLYDSMDITKAQPKYILLSPCNHKPKTYTNDSVYIAENYYIIKESITPQIILYQRKQ